MGSSPQRTPAMWRSWPIWRLLLPLLLLFPLTPHAQTIAPYSVEINGAGPLTPLLTRYLEINRHTGDTDMTLDELKRLAGITPPQIRELLATEGYFSASVEEVLEQRNGRWVARFNVVPGKTTDIGTVNIGFAGAIAASPDQRQRMEGLRQDWGLKAGAIFRQSAWDDAKSGLLKGLLNRDYPAARIAASEARIEPDRHLAQLSVDVDSGPAFTFGPLQIEGLQRYSRKMVEDLNPIEPGEPYSQEKLNELQARLQNTGYFRSAFATIEVDPAHPDRVPVRVDLNENERKRLALGGGFSTDSGARAQVKWLDRNFLQRDWRLDSELKIDRQSRLLGGDVFLPALGNGWRPSYGANYERTDISGEINDKIRTVARLTSPNRNDEQIWSVSYLGDRQRIAALPSNTRQALIASYGYTRRRLDNPLTPTRGYVASIELSAGPAGLVNEDNLARVVGQVTRLAPLGRRWNTILRAHVGQVFGASRETVPADLLFRTGGDQSVRGYAYNSLGVPQNGAIVGGTVFAVISAELVYQVTPQWGAALFTDAGSAADSWRDFRLQRGTGAGARWRSPIGPINIDVAYGHETRKPRLHFSVGYGF
ncbi:MAG: autotransporter assembly complex family protein [Pseudomonadota bacterium]